MGVTVDKQAVHQQNAVQDYIAKGQTDTKSTEWLGQSRLKRKEKQACPPLPLVQNKCIKTEVTQIF